jgi:hypothetical protein
MMTAIQMNSKECYDSPIRDFRLANGKLVTSLPLSDKYNLVLVLDSNSENDNFVQKLVNEKYEKVKDLLFSKYSKELKEFERFPNTTLFNEFNNELTELLDMGYNNPEGRKYFDSFLKQIGNETTLSLQGKEGISQACENIEKLKKLKILYPSCGVDIEQCESIVQKGFDRIMESKVNQISKEEEKKMQQKELRRVQEELKERAKKYFSTWDKEDERYKKPVSVRIKNVQLFIEDLRSKELYKVVKKYKKTHLINGLDALERAKDSMLEKANSIERLLKDFEKNEYMIRLSVIESKDLLLNTYLFS